MTAKQGQPTEVNNFVRGLITEVSPLAFPPDASTDEVNFVLNKDGSRDRRLGMDYENGNALWSTGNAESTVEGIAINVFKWEGVAGDDQLKFTVIQLGNRLEFHDLSVDAISGQRIGELIIGDTLASTTNFTFASVDGRLVVATGELEYHVISWNGTSFDEVTQSLKIRDLFGVEDDDEEDFNIRPTTLTEPHRFNLRNQSWATPRKPNVDSERDPIKFWDNEATTFPSNSDIVHTGVRVDDSVLKFFVKDVIDQPASNSPAAKGYFIIDAMNRGASRKEKYTDNQERNTALDYDSISSLPQDATPNGASVVVEYAERVFFAGFSGEVLGGDSRSPSMSNYVLFSQQVTNINDINKCYQEGDPTEEDTPDIVATDGGFIRISGVQKILKLVVIDVDLFVIASNGVWRVYGGNSFGFSADNFAVAKVSEFGCISAKSAVKVSNELYYWADDGIYKIGRNEFGDWGTVNITQASIQKFYDGINTSDKEACTGVYDEYTRRIRWMYQINRDTESKGVTKELIYDALLRSFYPATVDTLAVNTPRLIDYIQTIPFRAQISVEQVVVSVDDVQVNGEDIVVTGTSRSTGLRSIKYLALVNNVSGIPDYTVAHYKDLEFLDWKTIDGIGVDSPGYMETGFSSFGDTQRKKQTPYFTMHMRRTEDGFEDDGFGDLTPTSPSSCLLSTRWDWTNSTNSNRWSVPKQVYRYKRLYFPEDINDPYDVGQETIITKSKIRGRGLSVSLRMETEPGKDCRILGWAMMVNGNANV